MNDHEREPIWRDSGGESPSRVLRHAGLSREPFGPEPRSGAHHPVVVALAAMAGAAVMIIGIRAYDEWRVRVALEEVSRMGQAAMRQSQAELMQVQRAAVERQAQQETQLRLQESQRLQLIAEGQRMEEGTKRAAAAALDRKEKAWAKFYRKSTACSETATMECANAHIRAKREFEAKFARGELQ